MADLRQKPGCVYLVGAGPGDPELITARGLRLIESANIILYDHLAPVSLLHHAPEDVKTIYVGKKRTRHARTQQEINEILITEARSGRRVVRLKGGDAYIFGRGGEEAEALEEAGIPFVVVPGVTSAVGVAAYAGIPLTHRRETSSLTFVTGHDVDAIDWSALGPHGTLVIFMGLTTFPEIARRLIAAGRSPATPAAAVRWGTRGDQVTVEGALEDLTGKIEASGLKPPALIVVGEVVGLRPKLNWFEHLPLFGKRIVVTRPREQAASLCTELRDLGADVVPFPTIKTRPPDDWAPLDQAIGRLEAYDWLIFTSANGVRYFVERLDASSADLRNLGARLCAIGPVTAEHLQRLHLKVDCVPEEYVAESLLEALGEEDLDGKRILLPRAKVARDLIPAQLMKWGAQVDVVAAYETVIPPESQARAHNLFSGDRKPAWVTFTSSSTVKNFVRLCSAGALDGVHVASIGPVTTRTATELGIKVDVEAEQYTVEGLVRGIVEASTPVHV